MLVTGPECATGLRWGKKNQTAAVMDSSQLDKNLKLLIKNLRMNSNLRLELSAVAKKHALKNFDPATIRARLLKIFMSFRSFSKKIEN